MKPLTIFLLLALCAVVAAPTCLATTIYDNTTNNTFSTGVNGLNEIADDLHMASGGNMVSFQFGVVANGTTQATVRFYTNDATDSIWPGSGSALLHTEVVPVPFNHFGLITVPLGAPVALPQDIWMSLQFNNSSGQVRFFDPPTVGSSHDVVAFAGGSPANIFGTGKNNIQASITIPEPSTLALAAFGFIALAGWGWRFRNPPRLPWRRSVG